MELFEPIHLKIKTNNKLNMKKALILIGVLLTNVVFAKDVKEVEAKLKDVTVYLSGAELGHETTLNLKTGLTEIVFRDVASNILAHSIQASGKGDFIIMDVKNQVDYEVVEPDANPDHRAMLSWEKRIHTINDSLVGLNFNMKDYAYQKEGLLGEKNMILQNELVKGKIDSFPVLEQLSGFYRERIRNINQQLFEIEKKEYFVNQTKNRLNTELAELNQLKNAQSVPQRTKMVNKVIVLVSAEKSVYGSLSIKYMVPSAGWTPQYDLRVENDNDQVQMVYKANVFQNTGLNWENIKLKLATSNPNQRHQRPNLFTMFVDFYQAYVNNTNYGALSNARPQLGRADIQPSAVKDDYYEVVEEELDLKKEASFLNSVTQVVESALHVEYLIPIAYDIPSDGQQHMIYVQRNNLKAEYEHYAVPKVNSFVYLMANIQGFKDLQLLPGPSNIYFDGTYIGQSSINPNHFNDTLEISLGVDKMVAVKRKLKNKEDKDNLALNKTTTNFEFEITVKNNRKKPIHLKLLDQIPLSRQKEIEVALLVAKKADLNKDTGILTWELDLASAEERKLEMAFSIKFPKDKKITPII